MTSERTHDGLADRAMLSQSAARDTEIAMFGLVAVTHPASDEPLRTTGEVGQGFGEPAARARFRGRHGLTRGK